MHEDPLRNINPNTLYGCHPLDLRSKFEDHPFYLIVKQPQAILPKVSPRLRLPNFICIFSMIALLWTYGKKPGKSLWPNSFSFYDLYCTQLYQ